MNGFINFSCPNFSLCSSSNLPGQIEGIPNIQHRAILNGDPQNVNNHGSLPFGIAPIRITYISNLPILL